MECNLLTMEEADGGDSSQQMRKVLGSHELQVSHTSNSEEQESKNNVNSAENPFEAVNSSEEKEISGGILSKESHTKECNGTDESEVSRDQTEIIMDKDGFKVPVLPSSTKYEDKATEAADQNSANKWMVITQKFKIPPELSSSEKKKLIRRKLLKIRKERKLKESEGEEAVVEFNEVPGANKPVWIWDGLDNEDELLLAFHRRPGADFVNMCVLCYEWFESDEDVKAHMYADHVNNHKLHKCRTCHRKFIARFQCLRHEKMHQFDMNAPASIIIPPKPLPIDYYLTNHFTKRLKPIPLNPQSAQHFTNFCDILSQIPFECIECGKQFKTEELVIEHYETSHAVRRCLNEKCSDIFFSLKDLVRHNRTMHRRCTSKATEMYSLLSKTFNNVKFIAEIDKKTSDTNGLVEASNEEKSAKLLEERNAEEKPFIEHKKDIFPKKTCENSSPNHDVTEESKNIDKSSLDTLTKSEAERKLVFLHPESIETTRPVRGRNARAKHFTESLLNSKCQTFFKCSQCPRVYQSEMELAKHKKAHSASGDRPFICQFCNKTFASRSNHKEHERIHTGEKPYVCGICNKAFVQISNLKKHLTTHKSDSLQCQKCSKVFAKESSFFMHQRAHSQDRKFRCQICDRAYNYASLLKRHIRIHTGEQPYECDECGMLFHELVSLHYHRKKVHTGERPHKCYICDKGFILSCDLKKHLKTHDHHKTEVSQTRLGSKHPVLLEEESDDDVPPVKKPMKTYGKKEKNALSLDLPEGKTVAQVEFDTEEKCIVVVMETEETPDNDDVVVTADDFAKYLQEELQKHKGTANKNDQIEMIGNSEVADVEIDSKSEAEVTV